MDPLQTEINKYQCRKDSLCEILMEKETQFADYIRRLHAFEHDLLLHLSPLHKRLHRWERRCSIAEGIIQKLEKIDWTNQESPTELHPWFREIEQNSQWEELPPAIQDSPRVLKPIEQQEAKTIYRKLARRFHPDLVDLPDIQERRQEVMSEINEAYRSGDLDALRELEYYPDIRNPEEEEQGEKWERLVREIALLQNKIVDCERLYIDASESELAMLMQLSDQSDSPFDHIEMLLKEKIQHFQERWLRLRNREEQCWLQVDGL